MDSCPVRSLPNRGHLTDPAHSGKGPKFENDHAQFSVLPVKSWLTRSHRSQWLFFILGEIWAIITLSALYGCLKTIYRVKMN